MHVIINYSLTYISGGSRNKTTLLTHEWSESHIIKVRLALLARVEYKTFYAVKHRT